MISCKKEGNYVRLEVDDQFLVLTLGESHRMLDVLRDCVSEDDLINSYENGKADGYSSGYNDGYNEGYEDGKEGFYK